MQHGFFPWPRVKDAGSDGYIVQWWCWFGVVGFRIDGLTRQLAHLGLTREHPVPVFMTEQGIAAPRPVLHPVGLGRVGWGKGPLSIALALWRPCLPLHLLVLCARQIDIRWWGLLPVIQVCYIRFAGAVQHQVVITLHAGAAEIALVSHIATWKHGDCTLGQNRCAMMPRCQPGQVVHERSKVTPQRCRPAQVGLCIASVGPQAHFGHSNQVCMPRWLWSTPMNAVQNARCNHHLTHLAETIAIFLANTSDSYITTSTCSWTARRNTNAARAQDDNTSKHQHINFAF
eukprot:351557-Chlamydomonas_euryale.AAC.10